ncbi:MAG: hypothetical protein ACYDHP_06385 [Ferrimicrobium sp.]
MRNRKVRPDEHGDALILVVIAVLLITLIPAGLVAASVGQIPQARQEQQLQGAFAAAEAGVSDYLNRLDQTALNQTGNYWQYTASNPPPDGNTALTGWAAVQGSSSEYYHYSVNNQNTSSTGIVTLTSTGVAIHGAQTSYQTVQVRMRSQGFLDYLLLTNKMIVDPVYGTFAAHLPVNKAEEDCNYTFGQPNDNAAGSAERDNDTNPMDQLTTGPEWNTCSALINYYITGQTFNGPVFSNDLYYIYGNPVFNGPVYSASSVQSGYPAHPYWLDPISAYLGQATSDNPVFNDGPIQYHAPLEFPSTNSALVTEAQNGGCYYYGPTQITINGSTMDVTSPQTKNANCVGTNLPLPSNGVMYVASLPSSVSSTCNTSPSSIDIAKQSVPCQEGDAFVQGTLTGQLTLGSANNITITGNLEYTGCGKAGTTDILGLIANNFIQISDKFSSTNITPDSCYGHPMYDPTIMAALLTLNHSFAVQNFWKIPVSGTIYFYGSLAGNYADIEGVFNSATGNLTNGYLTNYSYDPRLAYLTPPYFLTPIAAAWQKISFSQIDNPTPLPTLPS